MGEIEAAAGLTPRSGGLYKRFGSKKEVLEAALDRHVSTVEAMQSVLTFMPLGDLRAELTLLARWTLQELAKQYDLCRVLERHAPTSVGATLHAIDTGGGSAEFLFQLPSTGWRGLGDGGRRYCATFGGTNVQNDTTRFKRKDAPALPCTD